MSFEQPIEQPIERIKAKPKPRHENWKFEGVVGRPGEVFSPEGAVYQLADGDTVAMPTSPDEEPMVTRIDGSVVPISTLHSVIEHGAEGGE